MGRTAPAGEARRIALTRRQFNFRQFCKVRCNSRQGLANVDIEETAVNLCAFDESGLGHLDMRRFFWRVVYQV